MRYIHHLGPLDHLNRDSSALVVNAIHHAFKCGYFSGIYTLKNPIILTVKILVIINIVVWVNHIDILLSNELNVLVVTMTMVAMVTMATMEISIF